mgnify:CR=1 FL=1|tara:strand:+ start:244 stop:495 length:252 start_codon:yes stop_codon:yes gene_type:complete
MSLETITLNGSTIKIEGYKPSILKHFMNRENGHVIYTGKTTKTRGKKTVSIAVVVLKNRISVKSSIGHYASFTHDSNQYSICD